MIWKSLWRVCLRKRNIIFMVCSEIGWSATGKALKDGWKTDLLLYSGFHGSRYSTITSILCLVFAGLCVVEVGSGDYSPRLCRLSCQYTVLQVLQSCRRMCCWAGDRHHLGLREPATRRVASATLLLPCTALTHFAMISGSATNHFRPIGAPGYVAISSASQTRPPSVFIKIIVWP